MFRLGLEILGPKGQGEIHEFMLRERGKITVGRQDCELTVSERSVSRRHLGFGVQNGKLVAGDLGSSGGTLHNGRPLHRGKAVKGDLFQIGSATILVRSFEKVESPALARLKSLVSRAPSVAHWLQRLRPRTGKSWAMSFALAAAVVITLHVVAPPKPEFPDNPYAPREAGFGEMVNWKSVRNWVRAKTYAWRKIDPVTQETVDYERAFGD